MKTQRHDYNFSLEFFNCVCVCVFASINVYMHIGRPEVYLQCCFLKDAHLGFVFFLKKNLFTIYFVYVNVCCVYKCVQASVPA